MHIRTHKQSHIFFNFPHEESQSYNFIVCIFKKGQGGRSWSGERKNLHLHILPKKIQANEKKRKS